MHSLLQKIPMSFIKHQQCSSNTIIPYQDRFLKTINKTHVSITKCKNGESLIDQKENNEKSLSLPHWPEYVCACLCACVCIEVAGIIGISSHSIYVGLGPLSHQAKFHLLLRVLRICLLHT